MNSNQNTTTILIVDDNHTTRESLSFMLRGENHHFLTAASGNEALRILSDTSPDVILLDVIMPDMDGYELCHRIKQNLDWQHIPIILITALASQEALIRGLELGADEFLSKPVSSPELRARVQSMLRIKENYDALKDSVRLREDLAHVMAHDMRNPLAVVEMNSYVMGKKCQDPQFHKHVEAIQKQVRMLDKLVEETLLLARTSAQKLIVNPSLVDLNGFISSIAETTQPIADLAKVQLVCEILARPLEMLVDVNLLRRAIDNIVANAIKFSPENSVVSIELATLPPDQMRKVAIRIRDQGMGILLEDRERIFDRYEVGRLRREGIKQTGLGLAFSKLIVDGHHGRIYVTDNEPNGSVFVIEI